MKTDYDQTKAIQREVLVSLWKVHILHHASKEAVVGQWMLNELRRHGYDVSPGTLYPILHRMERLGWLESKTTPQQSPKAVRQFRITKYGKEVLAIIQKQVSELKGELSDVQKSKRSSK